MLGLDRWHTLVACMYAGSITGLSYAFGVYGGALKTQFDLSQSALDTIAVTQSVAGLVAPVAGLLSDRKGPAVAVSFGGTLAATMLFVQWMVATRLIKTAHPVLFMALPMVAGTFGLCSVVAGAFSSLVRSFPEERGRVVGLAKGWVGLSSGLLTQIYAGFVRIPDKDPSTLNFILFAAVCVAAATLLPAPFITVHPLAPPQPPPSENPLAHPLLAHSHVAASLLPVASYAAGAKGVGEGAGAVRDGSARLRFALGYGNLALAAGAVTAMAALGDKLAAVGRLWFSAGIVVLWACNPCLMVAPCIFGWGGPKGKPEGKGDRSPGSRSRGWMGGWSRESDLSGYGGDSDEEDDPDASFCSSACVLECRHVDADPEDIHLSRQVNLAQMVQTPEGWLLAWVFATVVGSGLFITTNAAQICEARGEGLAATVITLFSVSQTAGRVLTGTVSDRLLRAGIPRTAFLVQVAVLMGAGQALMLLPGVAPLYAGVLIGAAGFGGCFPLAVVVVGEVFGTKHHGSNYLFYDGFCTAIGIAALAKYVPQTFYQQHIVGGGHTCLGLQCFWETNLILAGLCSSAAIAACLLVVRTRGLYAKMQAASSGSS